MELVEQSTFASWCAAKGIGRSVKWPHSEDLTYPADESIWYRYRPNEKPHHLGFFVSSAVETAAAGSSVIVVPAWRQGRWWQVMDPQFWSCQTLDTVVRGIGIPKDYVGPVRFTTADLPLVTLLFTTALQFAGPTAWALNLLPEHGRCIIKNEDDGDLVGTFPTVSALDSFTAALRAAGWNEPTEPDPRVSATDPWLDIERGGSGGAV